jgi:parallel beta-helix repeat protein
MSLKLHGFLLWALAMGGCSDPAAALCTGVTNCKGIAAGSPEANVQKAVATATEGTTIVFGEGTFAFTNGFACGTAQKLVIKGQGMDKTILDFKGQTNGGQAVGIYCNRDGFTVTDLTVRDTYGDAVKVEGASDVTFRRVRVAWTNEADPTSHGAYGLYPVQCKNVLIEDSEVNGASDAGVYVGQSENIVVRRNTAHKNVAGIEIENSHAADVYDNTSTDNTAGVLVFALPGLQKTDTKGVRVYQNMIIGNNRHNFAGGGIVKNVPAGIGMLLMAADSVEVFKNTLGDNGTGHIGVVSYFLADQKFTSAPNYTPYPTNIWIHDNTFTGGGTMPDKSNVLGAVLALTPFPNMVVSTVVYDGILDPMRMGTRPGNSMDICLSNNGTITFANLHADMMSGACACFDRVTFDSMPYECMLTPLPPVTFPGLM